MLIIKKWLNKNITKSNKIVKTLDAKYNEFVNGEIMSDEDKRIYYLNDGICCIAYTLIKIIDGKRYISKLSQLNFKAKKILKK